MYHLNRSQRTMLSNLFEVYKGLVLGNSSHHTSINHPRVPAKHDAQSAFSETSRVFNAHCDVADSDFLNSISTAITTSPSLTNLSPTQPFIRKSSIMITPPIPNITYFPPCSRTKRETQALPGIPAQESCTSLRVSTHGHNFCLIDLIN